jgi:hypothetical protein
MQVKPIIHDIPRTEEMIERCNLAKETVYIELDEAHCNLQEKQFQGKRKKNALANLGLLHTGHSPDTLTFQNAKNSKISVILAV